MRKKNICLSIIAGLFLSIGLEGSKKEIEIRNTTKQNISSFLSIEHGPTFPEPELVRPVTVIFNL